MSDWKSKWFPSLVAVFPAIFPLYLFKSTWFGVPVTMVEMALVALVILFVFTEKIWSPKWWSQNAAHWKLWPVVLFVLAAVVSTFIVQGPLEWLDGNTFESQVRAFGIMKGWILAPLVYFFIARHTFAERPSYVTVALDSMLLGGAYLSVQALGQEVSGEFLTTDGRASGPFESANYLSLYLGPLLVYGVLQSFDGKSWDFRRSIRLVLALLVAAGLYFTESYAAWIGVSAAFGLWSLLSLKKLPKKWRMRAVFGLILTTLVLVVSQLGSDKLQQFLEFSERSSSSVRLEIYDIALSLISQHPFLGIGLGQFEWFYQVEAVNVLGHVPFEWVMLHPHNVFLAMWLNLGLAGLIAFVWLCTNALAWLFEKDHKGRRVAAFMLVSLLIHGLFDTPYFKNDLAFQFWLMMAILL
jgi:O-antigen ligase